MDEKKIVKRMGKDELNLIETAVFSLSNHKTRNCSIEVTSWSPDPSNPSIFTITGHAKHGLPNATARDVYLACMELSDRAGFSGTKVPTSKYELATLLGWPKDGRSYRRLTVAFEQLCGVSITSRNFWDTRDQKYKETGFGVLAGYSFHKDERGEGCFYWNEILFKKSLELHNCRPIDLTVYNSLESNVSKALFRYVDLKLFNRPEHQIDLYDLAYNKLGMTKYKYPAKVKEKLKPGIEELKAKGIADIEIRKSKTTSGWKVVISKPDHKRKATEHNQAKQLVMDFNKHTGAQGRPAKKDEIKLAKEVKTTYGPDTQDLLRKTLIDLKESNFVKKVKSFRIVQNYLPLWNDFFKK